MTTSITGLTSGLFQQGGLGIDSLTRRQDSADAVNSSSKPHDEVRLSSITTQQEAADALAFVTQSGGDISEVHSGLDPARVAQLIGLFDDE
ncbi:hypothetical protein [Desulfovibrio inopinatus]|uniref:hypothetical protein n=1 Tax=Desulfovibrio inopinatus TaxID=102109 RepID=UPI00041ACF2B|nr:hypothetical protein [Desulfovibrio inopinatus]